MNNLKAGDYLNNRYRINAIIAKGGMGAVYEAYDISLNLRVAIKENRVINQAASKQFQQEAIILASLKHPNLPRVTDHFIIGDKGEYLVMDFIDGEDLHEKISGFGSLSHKEVIALGIAVCDALIYLHNQNPPVLHRDIKPGNIKISSSEGIFLVDFGLAKFSSLGQITTTGAQSITPGYAPPEQYGQGTEPRSDIYSLGATLYTALTEKVPEEGLARITGSENLTSIRIHNPDVSEALASVIEKALEVDCDLRYTNAKEFKTALEKVRVEYKGSPIDDTTKSVNKQVNKNFLSQVTNVIEVNRIKGKKLINQEQQSKGKPRILWFVIASGIFLLIVIGLISSKNRVNNIRIANILNNNYSTEIRQEITLPIIDTTTTSKPVFEETTRPESFTTQDAMIKQTNTLVPTKIGGGTGEIAYVSIETDIPQIWIMNSDGSNKKQITFIKDGACQPDWSPDGSQIVFISPCLRRMGVDLYYGSGLYIINTDGSGLFPLHSVPGGDYDPDWSPDSTRIAFASKRDGISHIYIYHLRDQSIERISSPSSYDRRPIWSPDGELIAFETVRSGVPQIWIMNSEGGDVREFSNLSSGAAYTPSWAPEGNVITFSVGLNQPRLVGKQFNVPGAIEYPISNLNNIWNADYSCDGLWLVFELFQEGNRDIFRMNINGGEVTKLTDNVADDFDPVWFRP